MLQCSAPILLFLLVLPSPALLLEEAEVDGGGGDGRLGVGQRGVAEAVPVVPPHLLTEVGALVVVFFRIHPLTAS